MKRSHLVVFALAPSRRNEGPGRAVRREATGAQSRRLSASASLKGRHALSATAGLQESLYCDISAECGSASQMRVERRASLGRILINPVL
jgi:hypothetical protein